jgi:hypothetical protein
MRSLSYKAVDQGLQIIVRICDGLCCTPIHAISLDLLLDVDNPQLLPAGHFGIGLLFGLFGPTPLANSSSQAVGAAVTDYIQYFCASMWNPDSSVKLIFRRK